MNNTVNPVSLEVVERIFACLPVIHESFVRSYERSENSVFTQLQAKAVAMLASDGAMPMHEIARRMQMSKQQLTRFVDTLVQRGSLERYSKPTDRRTIYIKVTEEGQEELRRHTEQAMQPHIELVDKLSESEAQELCEAVKRFSDLMNKHWGPMARAEQEK